MEKIEANEAREHIQQFGDRLGIGDFTYTPEYPEGRDDICLVSKIVENGHDYGYDVIYLVWKEGGKIRFKEIANTRRSKDYMNVTSFIVGNDNTVTVKLSSGGAFSGCPWNKTVVAGPDDPGS